MYSCKSVITFRNDLAHSTCFGWLDKINYIYFETKILSLENMELNGIVLHLNVPNSNFFSSIYCQSFEVGVVSSIILLNVKVNVFISSVQRKEGVQ